MKNFLYVLLLFVLPFSSIAQEKELIRQQALKVAKATQTLDYSTIIKYTHSSLINMMGGSHAMLKMIENSMGKNVCSRYFY